MFTCVLGKGPTVYRTYGTTGTTVCQVDKTANRLCRAFVPQHAHLSPHAKFVTLYPESIRQLERGVNNRLLLRGHIEMNRRADEGKRPKAWNPKRCYLNPEQNNREEEQTRESRSFCFLYRTGV